MQLRLATIDDVPTIGKLCVQSVQSYFPQIGFTSGQIEDQCSYVGDPGVATEWIEQAELWLCEKDGQLVGVAGLKVDPWTAYFGFNYVYPAGDGAGGQLIQHCLQKSSAASCRWIVAEVLADNQLGIAHLVKHGFHLAPAERSTRGNIKMSVQLLGRSLDDLR